MRSVVRRPAFAASFLLAALLAVIVTAGPASAQSTSPSPTSGPSVNGQVSGALASGSTLTIRVDGTMPGGWQALHLLEASIMSGNQELERLRFDIEDNKLIVGEQDLIVGTGAVVTSEYLRVSGANVVVTTGGANISFEVDAHVVKAIPEDARFVLGVVDDFGESAEVTRSLAAPESGGITIGTVSRSSRPRCSPEASSGTCSPTSGVRLPAPPSTTPSNAGVQTDRAAKGRST